jgi:hypothetical protein
VPAARWGQRFSRLGAHLFQAHSRFDLKVAHFSIQYWYLPPGEVYRLYKLW